MNSYLASGSHIFKQSVSLLPQQEKRTLVKSNFKGDQLPPKRQNRHQQPNKFREALSSQQPQLMKLATPLRNTISNQLDYNHHLQIFDKYSDDLTTNDSKKNSSSTEKHPWNEKIGSLLKNKTNHNRNSSKVSQVSNSEFILNEENTDGLGSQKKINELRDWVKAELSKMNESIFLQDRKIYDLSQQSKKQEQQKIFSGPQTEQLNRILTLVQKTGNREDHKRNTKMIEELRQNILELHQTLNNIMVSKQKENEVKSPSLEVFQQQMKSINKYLENSTLKLYNEVNNFSKKIAQIQNSVNMLKNQEKSKFNTSQIIKGVVKFQGRMITLKYQQKISSKLIVPSQKNGKTIKTDSNPIQNDQSKSTIVTENIYYIDTQGYLLSSDGYYLLNSKNQQIRLTNAQIEILRNNKLL